MLAILISKPIVGKYALHSRYSFQSLELLTVTSIAGEIISKNIEIPIRNNMFL